MWCSMKCYINSFPANVSTVVGAFIRLNFGKPNSDFRIIGKLSCGSNATCIVCYAVQPALDGTQY